jgi:hypothetical protein
MVTGTVAMIEPPGQSESPKARGLLGPATVFCWSGSFLDPLKRSASPTCRRPGGHGKRKDGVQEAMLWCEPPWSREGNRLEVWHYRLFCGQNWQHSPPGGEDLL